MFEQIIAQISDHKPVLVAGPTASGKSALALAIAEARGGVIVNADASQIYDCWRVITARPDAEEEARAPHKLYGHVRFDQTYSAGHWLRDVTEIMATGDRPIIVGGTGLYFASLTQGLADIPATPSEIRTQADGLTLETLLDGLDPPTRARIDTANRARVQRAWEVLKATGRGLSEWQDTTAPPLLQPEDAHRFVFDAPKEWLTPRIEKRLDLMLNGGAIDEIRSMKCHFNPNLPAFRAIGVPELVSYLNDEITLELARQTIIISTRQYAKRQRTWFRKRCSDWTWLTAN